jgi:hypothetical protein
MNTYEEENLADWYISPYIERDGEVVGAGLYDFVANKLFGANLKSGEIHAPLWTNKGFRFGSYIGPGTDLVGNLRTGREPITDADRVAQAHDIRYTQATTPEEVRKADQHMIRKLNDIQKNRSDYRFNTYMGKVPIKAKMFLEDLGIMSKGSFSGMKGVSDPAEAELLQNKLTELEALGYGKRRKKIKPKSR